MAASNFSIRLDKETISALDNMAAECKVKRANVITWSLEAYRDFFEANGSRMLSTSDLNEILQIIRTRASARTGQTYQIAQFEQSHAAEDQHEPGKVIGPVAAGGAGLAQKKNSPKEARRKSSN